MRQRYCLSTQRASYLVAAWASAHTGSCHRHISSILAPAVTPGFTTAATETCLTQSLSSQSDITATNNPANNRIGPAGSVNMSPATGGDASKKVSLTSSTTAAPTAESVSEATERLRAALRILSVIEQAKSDEQKLSLSDLKEEVSPIDVEPNSEDLPLLEEKDVLKGSQTLSTAAIAQAKTSRANMTEAGASPAAAGPSNTFMNPATTGVSAVSWASATSSWVRNKQPKFWAIVNEAGGEDDKTAEHPTLKARRKKDSDTADVSRGATLSATQLCAAPAATASLSTSTSNTTFATMSKKGGENTESKLFASAGSSSQRLDLASAQGISPITSTAAPASPSPPTSSQIMAPLNTSFANSMNCGDPVSVHSICTTGSVPPFRSRYKKDVAHALSELLNCDPALGPQLLGQLSAESRRLMLIMGTASEYFGVDYGEVAEQIKEADTDRDNSISSNEFDAWVGQMAEMASTRRHDTPAASQTSPQGSSTFSTASSSAVTATGTDNLGGLSTVSVASTATPTALKSSALEERIPAQSVSGTSKTPTAVPAPLFTSSFSPTFTATQPEAIALMTTIANGPSPHVVAPSATLSRQRAEMAISVARAASARIIEVMQKNVEPLFVEATATKASSPHDVLKLQTSPPPGQQQQLSSPLGSLSSSSTSAVNTVPAAAVGAPGIIASKSAPTGAAVAQYSLSTRSAEVQDLAQTAVANVLTTSTTVKEVPPQKAKRGDPAYIPWPTFARIVLAAAPPFLAFGMLDNCTLVLAGGAIDNALSAKLGLTQMAAASLGGVVSGVAGIQVHGLAERFTRAKPPELTTEQQRSSTYLRAENVGNTLGMVVGLVIGMTPLLFMRRSLQATEEEAERKYFREEAARSHQRWCRNVEKAEGQARQALAQEEQTARVALVKLFAE